MIDVCEVLKRLEDLLLEPMKGSWMNMLKISRISFFSFIISLLFSGFLLSTSGNDRLDELSVVEYNSFVIVIPSYNTIEWYEKNIRSAMVQDYPLDKFRIIMIDDRSSDGSGLARDNFLKENPSSVDITYIRNEKRVLAMENIYNAIQMCSDEEIIYILDGDDWMPHNEVLSRLNKEYVESKAVLVYGQHQDWPSGNMGYNKKFPSHVIKNRLFRKYDFVTAQPRTFYAWLFKKIKKEDLFYDGKFVVAAYDAAMLYPMLEMAGDRISFIDEVLYTANRDNPINDFRVNKPIQLKIHIDIRSRPSYPVVYR